VKRNVADGWRHRALWLLVLAGVVAGCAGMGVPAGSNTIYLVGHGWHTGIVLPWTDEVARAWPPGLHVRQARYVEVGWGEREFYPAPRNSSGAALRALFWRNESVLHLVAFDAPVSDYFPAAERVAVGIDSAAYRRLIAAVGASFARAGDGRALPLAAGLYGDSRFYGSRDRYHLFNTCNVWTADKLRQAGLPVAPWRAITTGMLLRQARGLGRAE